ncbi:MAG: hypothetical protein ACR2HJ_04680 [Fimbriimonadales bacterium]
MDWIRGIILIGAVLIFCCWMMMRFCMGTMGRKKRSTDEQSDKDKTDK